MPTPQQIEQALLKVRDQATFINDLLVDTLQWPIAGRVDNVEEISYPWSKAELRAADLDEKLVENRALQLANLYPNQPWGVFLLEFVHPDAFTAERGMTGTLRTVLRGLVPSRRRQSSLPAWKREHLLFICTHDYTRFRFAYFKDPAGGEGQPRLAAFGWQTGSTAIRTVCEFNLSKLGWPHDPSGPEQWVEQWADAFDVEKVTKRFYDEYKAEFERLQDAITELAGEQRKMFTQSLMNRLLFLRFVERKGWFEFPAGRRTRQYLNDLFEAGGLDKASVYVSRLRCLFFEGLAIEGRQQTQAIGKVHFLNGGLFEKSASDERVTDIPDRVLAPIIASDGLFYRYNFTVEESTPLDIEVAVDPEMLGKVFEELVTGRHESGSYYTPRPIVAFMCREALKGYLQDKTSAPAESITALVDRHEVIGLSESHGLQIRHALDSLKAVDPACGSGAYLLGLMHELIALYRLLQNEKLVPDSRSLYELKLRIISQNLYGVDIDPFATNIAMLRLWLSLAVDSDEPVPLPNLDFKIETGDSLTGPCDPIGSDLHTNVIYRLAERAVRLKDEYLQAHGEHKARLKDEIENYRQTIARELHHENGTGRAIDWYAQFTEVFASPSPVETTIDGRFGFAADASRQRQFKVATPPVRGGFDIVLANPPYIRQELIKDQKRILRTTFPEIYAGSVDLCCYFYGRSIQLLRPGGMLAFISSNKWMRAGYGRNLRSFLLRHALPKRIVDFGHSPIFPEADTFPCVPVLARRRQPLASGEPLPDGENFAACIFPRDDYRPDMDIGPYVGDHSKSIPVASLRNDSWTLEGQDIQRLLERVRSTGVPLKEFCGSSPLYGVKSGLNEAFYVDKETRRRLTLEDGRSAELLKPLLRGRDIDRWRPRRSDTFIIFTRRGIDIKAYPAIERHLSQYRQALEARAGEQAWYELQASPSDDFARVMFRPKIIYQEIQFHSWFSLETEGACVNNKVFMLPTDDLALLGILSSPLMWWFLTRTLPHMKDEALCPAGFLMENLRVTTGTDEQAAAIRETVERLVTLTDSLHRWEEELCAEVCNAAGIDEPDDRIVGWLSQPPEVFNGRLMKLAGRRRTPERLAAKTAALQASGRARQLELLRRQLKLERRLATLAEDAFGLTPDERELLRATRPVRDPLDVLSAKIGGEVQEEPVSP